MVGGALSFGGARNPRSSLAVIGVPLECCPSFREGARWGPLAVRKASNFIEFRSELSGLDADYIGFDDLGDLPLIYSNKVKSLEIIEEELKSIKKVPIILGGEHTLTYAAVRALKPECLVVFDAHLDAREEYLGDRWSHACWLRRLLERINLKVAVVGARAYVDEEVEFLKGKDVLFSKKLVGFLSRFLSDCERVYVSVDMDYFDPGLVPGVSNPEPGGSTFEDFLEHLSELRRLELVGADVVELAPPYDPTGASAVYAVRAIVELVTSLRLP